MKFLELNQTKADSELWYTEQSFKALNQTLGRAIRNKEDHAVILLFDQRYLKEENIKHLSGWFTKCLRATTNNYQHINDFINDAPWLTKNNAKEVI
jgi:Rad3-related DNA helicase